MANLNVGIREAKANLSKLPRMVEKGKEIVLTDHGRPVGKLVPIDKGVLPLSARIKEMEEMGILEPVTGKAPDACHLRSPLRREWPRCFLRKTGKDFHEQRKPTGRCLLGYIGGALISLHRRS
jgi:prevent-host-death family protein